LCAAQARDLNPKYSLANCSDDIYHLIRQNVPYLEEDGVLSGHIEHIATLVQSGSIAEIVNQNIQDLA